MENLNVLKTYKMLINGAFVRSESGRYFSLKNDKGWVANICKGSKKDFRDAVVAANTASGKWAEKTAYNRSQILYRAAEMLQSRKAQIVDELEVSAKNEANEEVGRAIDALVSMAGWCDKYQQVFSAVNPVAGSYFNFSVYEPVGVVVLMFDEEISFSNGIYQMAAAWAGGNTVIALFNQSLGIAASGFSEVLQTSDFPAGVANIMPCDMEELAQTVIGHMNIFSVAYYGNNKAIQTKLQEGASINVKRLLIETNLKASINFSDPYRILDFMEVKTTWHPIENIGGAASSY